MDSDDDYALRLAALRKAPLEYEPERGAARALAVFAHNCERQLLAAVAGAGVLAPALARRARATAARPALLALQTLERADAAALAGHWAWLRGAGGAGPLAHVPVLVASVRNLIDAAFDQYRGVRRVGDLRSVPRQGAALYAAAAARVRRLQLLSDALFAYALGVARAAVALDVRAHAALFGRLEAAAERHLAELPREYDRCVYAVTLAVGCCRSRDAPGLAHTAQQRLVDAVIAASVRHERRLRDRYERTMALADQTGEAARRRVYGALGGRAAVERRSLAALDAIRPWVVDWLQVQRDAFAQREVYGDSNDDLERALNASVDQVAQGFEEIMQHNVVGCVVPLIDDVEQIEELVRKEREEALSPRKKR